MGSSEYYSRQMFEKMNVDALPGSYNKVTLPYVSNTLLDMGRFIKEDANGAAVLAVAGDLWAYLNTIPSNFVTVGDHQGDPYDPTAISAPLEAGGLSGLVGNGIKVHIAITEWDTTTVGSTTPVAGAYVCVGANGKPMAVAAASISGKVDFGVITEVNSGRVIFIFKSLGTKHA